MSEVLVLQMAERPADDAARWIVVDSNGTRIGPPVMGPLSAATVDAKERRVIVLVPATEVLSTSVDIPLKSAVKIQQALPFALEEQVADDVDELHFAAGARRTGGRIPVAVVNRTTLEGWLERLYEAGLHPSALIAANDGLANIPGTISLLLSEDTAYINDGGDVQLVLQEMGPTEALQAIGALDAEGVAVVPEAESADEADEDAAEATYRPKHLLIYCDADSNQKYADDLAGLRDHFESVDVKLLADGSLSRLAVTVASGSGVNLLQGAYGPKAEYAGYLKPWRYAAMLLLALGVVGATGKAVANYKLSNREAQLQESFIAEYQEIAPGTAEVRDPLAIISSLRNRTGASGSGPSVLLQSLEQLGNALQDNEAATVQAVSYRSGVTNVRLTAPSVAMLDSIQRLIDESGTYQAEIQSTDQNDDTVNSRIEITAVSP